MHQRASIKQICPKLSSSHPFAHTLAKCEMKKSTNYSLKSTAVRINESNIKQFYEHLTPKKKKIKRSYELGIKAERPRGNTLAMIFTWLRFANWPIHDEVGAWLQLAERRIKSTLMSVQFSKISMNQLGCVNVRFYAKIKMHSLMDSKSTI